MRLSDNNTPSKRRAINLTIRQDILDEAKRLNLNTSKAAEAGVMNAVKSEQEKQWLDANRDAIKAYNKRIEEDGPLLAPYWLEELDG